MNHTGYILNGTFHETDGGILVPQRTDARLAPNTVGSKTITRAELDQLLADAERLGVPKNNDQSIAELEQAVADVRSERYREKRPPLPVPRAPMKPTPRPARAPAPAPSKPAPVVTADLDDELRVADAKWEQSSSERAAFEGCTNSKNAHRMWVEEYKWKHRDRERFVGTFRGQP